MNEYKIHERAFEPLDLEPIKKRLAAATKIEYHFEDDQVVATDTAANKEFVEHAYQDIPRLIQELERLRDELRTAHATILDLENEVAMLEGEIGEQEYDNPD